MLTLQLYGFNGVQAGVLRMEIFALFAGKNYVNDMTVTIVHSEAIGKGGEPRPYVLLCSTPNESIPEIVEELQKLKLKVVEMSLK